MGLLGTSVTWPEVVFLNLRRKTDRNVRGYLLENHFWHLKLECVNIPVPAHQVLPLTEYIYEASYRTSAKIRV